MFFRSHVSTDYRTFTRMTFGSRNLEVLGGLEALDALLATAQDKNAAAPPIEEPTAGLEFHNTNSLLPEASLLILGLLVSSQAT